MKQRILAILKHSSPWSYSLLILLGLLLLVYLYKFGNVDWTSMAEGFWNWTGPVAGIMTFITALAIFWFQASKNWEESLEKQLSADYFHIDNSNHLASVQNAYLAGEGDIRAWAQALGRQMMGQLDFDMNWNDPKPKIVFDSKQKHYIKHYQVLIYLISNPLESDEGKAKAEKFLKKSFKHSEIKGDLSNLFYLDKPFWSVDTMFYTKMKIT